MSEHSYSDNPILNSIFDDEPTIETEGSKELEVNEGVVGFVARARSLGYGTNTPEPLPRWMTDLAHQLDAAPVIDGVEVDA